MNIIKEIEKLIYWYIPALFIANILGALVSAEVKATKDITLSLSYALMGSSWLIQSIDNIVIAIWLFFFTKKLNEKYILWALFGLVAHIFAVVTFLAIKLLQELNLTSVTEKTIEVIKDINSDEVTKKPSKRKLFIWSK